MRRRARRAPCGAARVIAGTKPYDEPPLPKRPRNDGQGKLPSAIGAISGARERFRTLFHKSAFCDLRKHRSQSGLSAAEATEACLDRHFKRLFRKEGSRRGRRGLFSDLAFAFAESSFSIAPSRDSRLYNGTPIRPVRIAWNKRTRAQRLIWAHSILKRLFTKTEGLLR